MTNDRPDAPNQFGCRLSEEMTEENKKLLAKIDSKSILLAPEVKGSIYFYINAHDAEHSSKEDLIDDPSALDPASNDLGIEIRNENKHHRWNAQIPQALKILEFAAIYLNQRENPSSSIFGVNAELKWWDEQGLENIIHLSRNTDKTEWPVTRYT